MSVADLQKDRDSALAKYSDSVYELNMLRGNTEFYRNMTNIFLVLTALILLYNVGVLSPILLYSSLAIVSLFGTIYLINTIRFNENKRDGVVYDNVIFKSS